MPKKVKRSKRAAHAENLDDWSSMPTTNGDTKVAGKSKKRKNYGSAVAATQRSSKKAKKIDALGSEKTVQSSKDVEIDPRTDGKRKATNPAGMGSLSISRCTIDNKKGGRGKAVEEGL